MTKKKILLACPMTDKRSGLYIYNSLIENGCKVATFDWRRILEDRGVQGMNLKFEEVVTELKPDITLIIKGLGLYGDTIKRIKTKYQHKIVGWMFDVTINGTYVKDVNQYVKMCKELDVFYTIDNDAVKELATFGVNAKWLPEAIYVPEEGEQVLNSVQKRKYGADVVFIGTVGGLHKNRENILRRISEEGFDFKIYGNVMYGNNTEPDWVKLHHTGFAVLNDMHATVVGSSKVIIGIDGWPERDKAYSQRLYTTLAAGGFYLTTHTKGITDEFVIGKHLETYKDENELVTKLLMYLKDNETREKIAKTGQELVLEKHTYPYRIKTLLKDIEPKSKHLNI